MSAEVSRAQDIVQVGTNESPEQSLDLKAYRAGFQSHWTMAERLAYVEAHPAEHAEWLRRQEPTESKEKRRTVRAEQTGDRYVYGLDGKVYPGSARLPDQTWVDILVMHADGYSMRKIAAKVGCSVGTAHRIAKNYTLAEATR